MASAKRKSNGSRKKLRYEDLVSTRPGSLAGNFMRRFWHPIHRAEELRPGEAKPIEIMSERFTLYRGESWNTSRRRISLPASRHAAFRRLGRRRLHPLRLSRLAV